MSESYSFKSCNASTEKGADLKSRPLRNENVNHSLSTPLPDNFVGHGVLIPITSCQSPELSHVTSSPVAQASGPCSPNYGHPLPSPHHDQQNRPSLPPLPASAPAQYPYAPPRRIPGIPASVPIVQPVRSLPIHPATAPLAEPSAPSSLKERTLKPPKPSKPDSTESVGEKIYQGTRIPRNKLTNIAFKCLDKKDRGEEKRKWKRRLEVDVAMRKEQEKLFSASRERFSGASD